MTSRLRVKFYSTLRARVQNIECLIVYFVLIKVSMLTYTVVFASITIFVVFTQLRKILRRRQGHLRPKSYNQQELCSVLTQNIGVVYVRRYNRVRHRLHRASITGDSPNTCRDYLDKRHGKGVISDFIFQFLQLVLAQRVHIGFDSTG